MVKMPLRICVKVLLCCFYDCILSVKLLPLRKETSKEVICHLHGEGVAVASYEDNEC